MSQSTFPLIFDGHNDTVHRLIRGDLNFINGAADGHIDLPRVKAGGMGGGFFAVYLPDPQAYAVTSEARARGEDPDEAFGRFVKEHYGDETYWPEPMPLDYAQAMAVRLMGALLKLEAAAPDQIEIVRTAADLERCIANEVFAILLHFEGAEPLDASGEALELFYAAGLRSVGLTHSRRNRYCEGVPFKFPSSPDTGPGLNDMGRDLVRQLNAKKVMIDLSHINEKGFWDVAELSDAPLVATHSNAWELANAARNLTDRQMAAVGETNGVVGLNFHVGFLRADGKREVETPLSEMVDHVEYMVEHAGIDSVAIGSDFDGCLVPSVIGDAAGLPKLMQAIADRGYGREDLAKIAHGNWIRVLRETWGE